MKKIIGICFYVVFIGCAVGSGCSTEVKKSSDMYENRTIAFLKEIINRQNLVYSTSAVVYVDVPHQREPLPAVRFRVHRSGKVGGVPIGFVSAVVVFFPEGSSAVFTYDLKRHYADLLSDLSRL
jgi:hypothetical protein